jgi:AGCS family alanine or glycine:cation symporter
MTGTFWDTIVVCTITGLCIASSGVLGITSDSVTGTYNRIGDNVAIVAQTVSDGKVADEDYLIKKIDCNSLTLISNNLKNETTELQLSYKGENTNNNIEGTWCDSAGNEYVFDKNGKYTYKELVQGSALTIEAFSVAFKKINKNFGGFGAWLVTIGITLFAFSTILGWEYHGEKAFEYIFKTHKYNMVYRVVFSLVVYVGATQSLQLVWNFSDIANALMAIPNLICLLAMSGVIAKEVERYQKVIEKEKN